MAEIRTNAMLARLQQLREVGFERHDVDASNHFVADALLANKKEGLKLAIQARWAALAVSSVLVLMLNDSLYEASFYFAGLVVFALIGWAQLRAGTVGRSGREVFLIFCDIALLTTIFLVPNPLREGEGPSALQYHFLEFSYFYVLLAAATLGYTWRTLSVFGIWVTALWLGALVIQYFFGNHIPELSERMRSTFQDFPLVVQAFDPNDLEIAVRVQEVVVFLIVMGILMINSRRNTDLFYRQIIAAQERSNLARHFSPTIVEQLAHQNEPLAAVRSQKVAIMFVDIVGFTSLAEKLAPEEMVKLLRELHGRLEHKIFEHHGTLDKFLGDGLMASFGNPETSPEDASNALLCGKAILSDLEIWNKERQAAGQQAINLSIGIHYGEVVLGDIGSERRLEYAVLGDAVNVASRLEALTRELGQQLIVSDELVQSLTSDTQKDELRELGNQQLKGRQEPVVLWGLD